VTDVLAVDPHHPERDRIERAATLLRRGGLVAFPTETVYGLGVNALDREAVRRLFEAKGRPATDPLIVHVGSLEDAMPLVAHVPAPARTLAARFWPGPLTLVLPRSAAVPDEVTAGLETVAIRVPAHPVARALIAAAGVPTAAPSANLFSRPSPTCAAHVIADLGGRIDLVLDGGPTEVGVESTVLDLARDPPVILRPGAVTAEMLHALMPHVVASAGDIVSDGPLPSPGLLEKHYSPRAPLTLYEGDDPSCLRAMRAAALALQDAGTTVGMLIAKEDRPWLPSGDRIRTAEAGSLTDLRTVAARLYAALRELDAAGAEAILARDFPRDRGLGDAIHDRLRRAAGGRIVRC
jgi:L-threonylcarbamoyladenylate synthase